MKSLSLRLSGYSMLRFSAHLADMPYAEPHDKGPRRMVFIRESELLSVKVHPLVTILRRKGEYNAANQLSSAADSIYANVTEGYGRGITRDGLNYFRMGRASCGETEGHLRVNAGKGLLPASAADAAIDHAIRVRFLILRYSAWLERRINEKGA